MPVFEIGLDDGRRLHIEADDQAAALAGVQHFQDSEKSPAPSGVIAGLQHGMANLGDAATARALTGAGSADSYKPNPNIEPSNYQPASLSRDGISALPQIIAENLPGMGQDLVAGKTGASIGSRLAGTRGAAIGGAVGYGGSMLLRQLGLTAKANAVDATNNPDAEPTAGNTARAAATSAAQLPLNMIAGSRLIPGIAPKIAEVGMAGVSASAKRALATLGIEYGSGAANSVIGQAGSTVGTDKGLRVDPSEANEAGITRAATSSLLVAPRAAADATSAVNLRKFGGDNTEAAKVLAARYEEALDGKNLVGPLGSTKVTNTVRDSVHKDVHNELSDAVNGETGLPQGVDNTLSRIQSGGTANPSELAAVDTHAAPETASLARQALLSARLKTMGGGISGAMDTLPPITAPFKTAVATGLAAAGGGHFGLGAVAPAALGGFYGAYGIARGFDTMAGNRSPLQGFINKFGDTGTPVRPAAPQVPIPPQATTSVPQIAPPQNTALWGNPAAPQPTLAKTLNSNVVLHQGMAKIAAQLGAAKQKSMIADAIPALQQLAATRQPVTADVPAPAPEAPQLSPIALKMLGARIKAGLPPTPPEPTPEPPAAPEAPPSFNPTALAMLKQKLKQGLPPAAAPAVTMPTPAGAGSPPIELPPKFSGTLGKDPMALPDGFSSTLSKPSELPDGFASTLGRGAVSDAPASPAIGSLMAQLQAQGNPAPPTPAAPPAPPLIAKITKKLNGKVNEVPHPQAEEPFTHEYAPLSQDELWGKGMSDKAFAEADAAKKSGLNDPEAYKDGIIRDRKKRRGLLADITGEDTGPDAEHAADLMHELHHVRRAAKASGAIHHFTAKMSEPMRHAIRTRMDKSFVNSMWKN
jgi:hypothetical protein